MFLDAKVRSDALCLEKAPGKSMDFVPSLVEFRGEQLVCMKCEDFPSPAGRDERVHHSTYAMLLKGASAFNRTFRGLSGVPGEVPHTYENTPHGGPSARRALARRAMWPPCVVFANV
jgi:hypothetical protein